MCAPSAALKACTWSASPSSPPAGVPPPAVAHSLSSLALFCVSPPAPRRSSQPYASSPAAATNFGGGSISTNTLDHHRHQHQHHHQLIRKAPHLSARVQTGVEAACSPPCAQMHDLAENSTSHDTPGPWALPDPGHFQPLVFVPPADAAYGTKQSIRSDAIQDGARPKFMARHARPPLASRPALWLSGCLAAVHTHTHTRACALLAREDATHTEPWRLD